jgi:hypothetical protein
MGWLIERKIRKILKPVMLDKQIEAKVTRCRVMLDNKTPGGVKLLQECIKLAKKAKYERELLTELENVLRQYKLDTPKSLW